MNSPIGWVVSGMLVGASLATATCFALWPNDRRDTVSIVGSVSASSVPIALDRQSGRLYMWTGSGWKDTGRPGQ